MPSMLGGWMDEWREGGVEGNLPACLSVCLFGLFGAFMGLGEFWVLGLDFEGRDTMG